MRPMQAMTPERAMKAAKARAGKNRVQGKGHPTTADMEYSPREWEFMQAIQEFKRLSGRQFPTWCEVLRIVDTLGYALADKPHRLSVFNAA
jgi:hypothetical protein